MQRNGYWLNDEIMEATRKNTIEVTEQVSRETKMAVLQANIHAMIIENLEDDVIRRICTSVFSGMEKQIDKKSKKKEKYYHRQSYAAVIHQYSG